LKVVQLCARIEFGDAVSKHVLEIDRALRSWGFQAEIFANTLDEFGCRVARLDSEYSPAAAAGDLLIYHYSLFCPNYKQYLETQSKRILIYHNITPPEYFAAYDEGVAEFCRLGRQLLGSLNVCELALADSEYNRLELLDHGFDAGRTQVLPIFVDYDSLAGKRSPRGPMSGFGGSHKVLFVGRAVPNKRIEDLLRVFYYYNHCINADSHLFLVGPSWVDRYDAQLRWLLDSLGLWANVHFAGRVSEEDLASCYGDADVFLSMSEHEGFAVPLVESMAFDLPVIAYSSTAVPYTLDGAGLTFSRKDFPMVGELIESVRRDHALRDAVVKSQRARLQSFSPESVRGTLKEALTVVVGEQP
jgi:glycosyltransferase involved in cell wall biosynthesis